MAEEKKNTTTEASEDPVNTQTPQIAVRILSFLGKVATPTTIVAIFCTLVGLSQLDTTIISLVTILITMVIVLYHPISRAVPSPFIIILLIILSTVFFFGYQNILLKDTGLIKYWKLSKAVLGILPSEISTSKNEIWYFGTNFHESLTDNRELIIKKLSSGVKFRCLIFDPFSPVMDIAASDFDQTTNELSTECRTGLSAIVQLKRKWDSIKDKVTQPGELEIRVFSQLPRMRAYIFDPQNENSECIFIPYLHKTNSPELPAFQFKNKEDGVFNDYFASIRKLWQNSISFDDYRIKHPEIDTLFN
jgi:hypothetical protein